MSSFVMTMLVGFLITAAPYALLDSRPTGKPVVFAKAAPIAWLIAASWEIVAGAVGWTIRVDLLLTAPVLLLLSITACGVWVKTLLRGK